MDVPANLLLPRDDSAVSAPPAAGLSKPASPGGLFHKFSLSPINRRRWQNFRSNRRGYYSFIIFLTLFVVSLFAEVIANDKPILARYRGEWLVPVFVNSACFSELPSTLKRARPISRILTVPS